MTPEQILARMAEQRAAWVEVEPGKRVRVLRPLEADFPKFLQPGEGGLLHWRCSLDQVKSSVDAWEGFTEADLYEGGASDDVPFSPLLWGALVADRLAYAKPVAARVVDLIASHEHSLADAEKN